MKAIPFLILVLIATACVATVLYGPKDERRVIAIRWIKRAVIALSIGGLLALLALNLSLTTTLKVL